jgi:DnaJ-class molecular chaperone
VTKRRDIRREELVEEKNRREDESTINITYMQSTYKKGEFLPRRSYDRAEDWMVTCSVCHGTGTTGEGDSRKRCPNCDGAGQVSSTPQTRKLIRNST